MFLGGDIGGTKTNLALFKEDLSIIVETQYPSRKHESLDEIVQDFLEKNPHPILRSVLGIAGPIQNETVQTTNLPWKIQASSLSKITKSPVHLLNDLEANAWGISLLKKTELHTLQEGVSIPGNRALISAGTGLGEAGLYFDGNKHLPFASEGGHVDFAPQTEQEMRLLNFLSQEFGHVSFERVLSGQGLTNIYRFLLKDKKLNLSLELQNDFKKKDPALIISQNALENKDPVSLEALELLVKFYGAEASNTALKFLALGGVYLGGGIAPKILPLLEKKGFLEAFNNKGRFSSFLKKIPIHIILNDRAALLGAGACAKHTHLK